jgi:hypothetical protein
MTRVVDAFPLGYGEDVLLIRLRELADVVDLHVVVEADVTFTGAPRDPLWPALMKRPDFAPYADRVRWVLVELRGRDAWERDAVMRDHVLDAARHFAKPGDVLLFGDHDEIPHPDAVRMSTVSDRPTLRLPVAYYEWFLNLRAVRPPSGERYRWEFRQPVLIDPTAHRFALGQTIRERSGRATAHPHAPEGWHLTLQGGAERVHRKLRATAHTELGGLTLQDVRRLMHERVDIVGRCPLEVVRDEELPTSVLERLAEYREAGALLPSGPTGTEPFEPTAPAVPPAVVRQARRTGDADRRLA